MSIRISLIHIKFPLSLNNVWHLFWQLGVPVLDRCRDLAIGPQFKIFYTGHRAAPSFLIISLRCLLCSCVTHFCFYFIHTHPIGNAATRMTDTHRHIAIPWKGTNMIFSSWLVSKTLAHSTKLSFGRTASKFSLYVQPRKVCKADKSINSKNMSWDHLP